MKKIYNLNFFPLFAIHGIVTKKETLVLFLKLQVQTSQNLFLFLHTRDCTMKFMKFIYIAKFYVIDVDRYYLVIKYTSIYVNEK